MACTNHETHEVCRECLIRLAFEGLSTAIALTDKRCRITFINRAAQELFGLSPNDVNRPMHLALRDPNLLAFWKEAVQQEEPLMGLVRIRDPVERLLRATVAICRTADGVLIGRAILACDVTEDRKVALELTEEIARRLLAPSLPRNGMERTLGQLTPMEWRILAFLAKGLNNPTIARHLSISPNTLRTHLKSIYRKLNLTSRSAAVAFAVQCVQYLPEAMLTHLGEKNHQQR